MKLRYAILWAVACCLALWMASVATGTREEPAIKSIADVYKYQNYKRTADEIVEAIDDFFQGD